VPLSNQRSDWAFATLTSGNFECPLPWYLLACHGVKSPTRRVQSQQATTFKQQQQQRQRQKQPHELIGSRMTTTTTTRITNATKDEMINNKTNKQAKVKG
jgi:hypothetical protein